jgi:hypothetical protein
MLRKGVFAKGGVKWEAGGLNVVVEVATILATMFSLTASQEVDK